MAFNSYSFIFLFLPLVVIGHRLLKRYAGDSSARGWLLLASIAFYATASPASLAVLAPSILLDYLIVRALTRPQPLPPKVRTLLLAAGVTANIAFLGYFKYRNFFVDSVNGVFATHFALTQSILPLGISFLTFQKIALLVDAHAGLVRAVRLFDFLFFSLFFPRTLAGPIVRYQEIAPQLAPGVPRDTMTNLAVGVSLFSIGLFKKTVIADGLASFVNPVFDTAVPETPLALLSAWIGVLAYAFQLYFDFSGYSDMALGVARMVDIRLPMNFNSPFKATSIVEFWSRWHITLTRFLTDYVYTPLVLRFTRARMARGKAVLRGKRSTLAAIGTLVAVPTLVTMLISGLWHGAGWQFVVWGGLHGVYLSINQGWRLLRPRFWPDQQSHERWMKPIGFVLTFSAVAIALVFFRASSLESAWSILHSMAGANGVFLYDVQMLRNKGVFFPWSLVRYIQPVAPFVWVALAFLAATLLPNSLQLLGRFQPALDYAAEPAAAHGSRWSALRRDGAPLDGLSAAATALLCVLGIMALSRGGTFLYGAF